jgi:hypothetical protein
VKEIRELSESVLRLRSPYPEVAHEERVLLARFALAVLDALDDEWRVYGGDGMACRVISDIRAAIARNMEARR